MKRVFILCAAAILLLTSCDQITKPGGKPHALEGGWNASVRATPGSPAYMVPLWVMYDGEFSLNLAAVYTTCKIKRLKDFTMSIMPS